MDRPYPGSAAGRSFAGVTAATTLLGGPVLRVFTATPRPGAGEELAAKLQGVSTALVGSRAGLVGYLVAHPLPGDDRAHLFVTAWEDLSDVVSFAGDRWTQAVLPEGYTNLMADWNVTHYRLGGMALGPGRKS